MKKKSLRLSSGDGFTLLELLLVIAIIGVILSVVLPRALRANREVKFNQVRQTGSEIGSYIVQWAQDQVVAQTESSKYSIKDYLMESIGPETTGIKSGPIVNKYTGNENFNGVEKLVPPEKLPINPFNGASYFNIVNDDTANVPGRKPGLLYFVSGIDPVGKGTYRNFYFIYTGVNGNWHGQMNHEDPDAIRRGVFVTRLADSRPAATAGK